MKAVVFSIAAMILTAVPALAEYQTVTSRSEFVTLMAGKSLTRPLVKLQVTPDGQISGMGAAWPVTGSWTWEDGYLCRRIAWGGDDLGYNCQAVEADGAIVRITSDKGQGDSAKFTLR